MNQTAPDLGLDPGFPLSQQQRAIHDSAGAMAQAALLQVRIEGDPDRAVLQCALDRLRARHQVLASRFVQIDGYRGLRQQTLTPAPSVRLDFVEMAACLEQYRNPDFDLGAGDTMRACLLRQGDRQWQLLLACSPLVADRISLAVLSEELRRACAGAIDASADEPFQFEQFVAWRQELSDGDDAAAGMAYWAAQSAAMSVSGPALSYRTAQGAPGVRAVCRQPMPATLGASLARFIQLRASNAELVLHAAWLALLARLTAEGGQPVQLAAGWQHDCRSDYEALAGAVGPIGQVLPLPMTLAPAESFEALLEQLAGVCEAHREQQEYWQPNAGGTPPALGFVYGGASSPAPGAMQWQVLQLPGPSACFELALLADETELSIHYDSACYSGAAIAQLLEQYLVLLASALAQPVLAIDELPLLSGAAQARLAALNPAPLALAQGSDATVPAWIAHWSAQTPDALALTEGATRLTYAQLDAKAARLAGVLAAHGAAPGTVVALRLPRSLDLVLALLAVWRTGAAYLPIEPDWPAARQRAIVLDAEPVLMLGTSGAAAAPERLPCPYLHLPDLAAALGERAGPGLTRPSSVAAIGNAYILYTSGSTGTPKGVAIGHAQLANYVGAARQAMDLDQCRHWGLTSTVAADLGNTALFCALASGACLSVATAQDMQDGAGFARFMRHNGIDALKMVPSHLEALIDAADPVLPQTLVLGGEAASPALLHKIRQNIAQPAGRVFNHYGPTESTVGVMVHAVDPAQPQSAGGLPLSRVLANCRVYVLDRHMQLAPPGASGELYIGGAQLCQGYLKQSAAPAFVADPFLPGARLYRSGDRACYLPEGGLRLLGRLDHQVKIRGFRIEPAEIEAVMQQHDGVRQALVLAQQGPHGTELVACVEFVAGGAAASALAALREALLQRLPAAMQPARLIPVAPMPRLGNGKIDRRALALLAQQAVPEENSAALMQPRDALEAVLADTMAQLLERGAIGADQDFFELGGHSLLAIKLVARIRKLFRIEIAPALVFDHPSAIALGQALRALADDPLQLDKLAALRRQLAALSPQERAALEQAAEHAGAPLTA